MNADVTLTQEQVAELTKALAEAAICLWPSETSEERRMSAASVLLSLRHKLLVRAGIDPLPFTNQELEAT